MEVSIGMMILRLVFHERITGLDFFFLVII